MCWMCCVVLKFSKVRQEQCTHIHTQIFQVHKPMLNRNQTLSLSHFKSVYKLLSKCGYKWFQLPVGCCLGLDPRKYSGINACWQQCLILVCTVRWPNTSSRTEVPAFLTYPAQNDDNNNTICIIHKQLKQLEQQVSTATTNVMTSTSHCQDHQVEWHEFSVTSRIPIFTLHRSPPLFSALITF